MTLGTQTTLMPMDSWIGSMIIRDRGGRDTTGKHGKEHWKKERVRQLYETYTDKTSSPWSGHI